MYRHINVWQFSFYARHWTPPFIQRVILRNQSNPFEWCDPLNLSLSLCATFWLGSTVFIMKNIAFPTFSILFFYTECQCLSSRMKIVFWARYHERKKKLRMITWLSINFNNNSFIQITSNQENKKNINFFLHFLSLSAQFQFLWQKQIYQKKKNRTKKKYLPNERLI